MSPVAVRKWVNCNKPVMKTNGELIGTECIMLTPHACVLDEFSHLDANRVLVDADVLVRSPYLSSPLPHLAEHSPVQLIQKILGQYISAAPAEGSVHRPFQAHLYVRFFQ